MEVKKFLNIYLTKYVWLSALIVSCNSNDKVTEILKDVYPNSYYICLTAAYNGQKYDVVIPNHKLYYIVKLAIIDSYNQDSHLKKFTPIVKGEEILELSEALYIDIKPYFLEYGKELEDFVVSKYFVNGVQASEIKEELLVIKQLCNEDYLVHQDDETGMLVITK